MVIVDDPAESSLEESNMIDREEFLEINKELKADGGSNLQKNCSCSFEPILMGITGLL